MNGDISTPLLHPDVREEKLPAWVKTTLSRLRATVRDRDRELAFVNAHHARHFPDADTFIDGGLGEDIPLGREVNIRFRVRPGGRAFNDSIRVRIRDGALYVMGDRPITIAPQASNTCELRTEL